jgi:hypothetical protein
MKRKLKNTNCLLLKAPTLAKVVYTAVEDRLVCLLFLHEVKIPVSLLLQ